jgi:hypothetical protein
MNILVANLSDLFPLTDTSDAAGIYRLMEALCHPENVEGWEENPIESRLAAIDDALGSGLDMETVNNLLEEKAEIMIALEKG